jgi:hypothetical protein
MAIFEPGDAPGIWLPRQLAAGPFNGLQGGAVAGLLTAEIEARGREDGWGIAVSAAAWFLRPTPIRPLRTQVSVLRSGGRVSVIDNSLTPVGEDQPCATVRVTLVQERAIEVPGHVPARMPAGDPTAFPQVAPPAPHGGPWFMDAMAVRPAGAVTWFRLKEPVIDGAGPLSLVLGPADWAHGIARPMRGVVADPNPNLTVHLARPPQGDWIGVMPETRWEPARGIGMGRGVLLDREGEIGSVSMAVALVPFPASARAAAQ